MTANAGLFNRKAAFRDEGRPQRVDRVDSGALGPMPLSGQGRSTCHSGQGGRRRLSQTRPSLLHAGAFCLGNAVGPCGAERQVARSERSSYESPVFDSVRKAPQQGQESTEKRCPILCPVKTGNPAQAAYLVAPTQRAVFCKERRSLNCLGKTFHVSVRSP